MERNELTFRVFVSSTFSDLIAERNALQEFTFPRLRAYCQEKGARFQAIDLRWGVNEEAARDQQTMNICLQELKRCQDISPRPNFIVLLGERYGWRPLPPQIEAGEFESMLKLVHANHKPLLLKWYMKDDNAVPPEYCLQPRKMDFPADNIDLDKQAIYDQEVQRWNEDIEPFLRSVLMKSASELFPDAKDPRRYKYGDSATHQEIRYGAFMADKPQSHVFAYFRTIEGLPRDKRARDYRDIKNEAVDIEAQNRLRILKEELQSLLPSEHIYNYIAQWCNGISKSDLQALCERVEADLRAIIDAELAAFKQSSELDREIDAQREFGRKHSEHFIGRENILKKVQSYIYSDDSFPLVIHGSSGSGKTALVAKATKAIAEKPEPKVDRTVISRFIGATPGSSDTRSLLESLCQQITRTYDDNEPVAVDYHQLIQDFPKRLALATSEKPLVILIDALDQLSPTDGVQAFNWLPQELPANVKLIVSVLEAGGIEGECYRILSRLMPPENLAQVEAFPLQQGEKLLEVWLECANRNLQPNQRQEVLDKFAVNGLPLFLKLAFEEARRWKSYDSPVELDADIFAIASDMLIRLENEVNHGRMLISRALGYLAAGRYGLTEDELLDVLSADEEVLAEFRRRSPRSPATERLPVLVWSRLFADLESYLTERRADNTTTLTFYHRQVGEVMANRYLEEENKTRTHRKLAEYFHAKVDPINDKTWKGNYPRALRELPYHQTKGELWRKLERTLTDLKFIEVKCAEGMTFDLIEDYNEALQRIPENQYNIEKERRHEECIKKYIEDLIAYSKGELEELNIIPSIKTNIEKETNVDFGIMANYSINLDHICAFSSFVTSESHALSKYSKHPGFVLQHAYNYANSGAVANIAEHSIKSGINKSIIIRLQHHRPEYKPKPTLIQSLEGHTGTVNSVSITPDGKLAVSGSSDFNIRVWNLQSGLCIKVLKKHTSPVEYVCVTPDGKFVVSGSADRTSYIWESESGRCLKTFKHSKANSITSDAKLCVSLDNAKIDIIDLKTGICLKTIEEVAKIQSVSMSANGTRILYASHHTCLWDLGSGGNSKKLQPQFGPDTSVDITPDGKRAVSGGWNSDNISVWDLEKVQLVKSLKGLKEIISFVKITADGKRIIFVKSDNTINLWDVEKDDYNIILTVNTGSISCISITPDGERAISGDYDNTLRFWNLKNINNTKTPRKHKGRIINIGITSDGRRAISGSAAVSGRVMGGYYDDVLLLWDVDSGKYMTTLEKARDENTILCVSPIERIAITGNRSRILRVWSLENNIINNNSYVDTKRLEGHTLEIDCAIITPDGKSAVTGSMDSTIRIWNLLTGKCMKLIKSKSAIKILNVTPEGRRVISGGWNSTIQVWDLKTGKCITEIEGYTENITCIILTPDGKRFISGNGDKILRIWDLETGLCKSNIQVHSDVVKCLNITPDGKRIVTGSKDRILRVLNLKTGQCMTELKGHTDDITCIEITPDATRIISGSRDKTLRIWNIETGNCDYLLKENGIITALKISRGGERITYGTDQGDIIILKPVKWLSKEEIITSCRLWSLGDHNKSGDWDHNIGATCILCGRRFTVPTQILDTIQEIASYASLESNGSPCLELPDEAWEEPGLISQCPHCHKPLKFNPFFVDNKYQ